MRQAPVDFAKNDIISSRYLPENTHEQAIPVAVAAFFSVGIACAQTSAAATTFTRKTGSTVATGSTGEAPETHKNEKLLSSATKTSFTKKYKTVDKGNAAAGD
ncbi:hypothetical protein AWB65_06671 [Caballeronia humi]|uniref:Uncharacterized protein n=1 Tax=Caballeronia humi TaxID=326474 RepID=A0A158JH13_9BURK|nr:hypothetical protein AWB65_06671 [Caballeronia humi]